MSAPDLILSYDAFIDDNRIVSDRDAFYRKGICPHCETTAPVVHHSNDSGDSGIPQIAWARACACGWWEIERAAIFGPDIGVDADGHEWAHIGEFLRRGILRSFAANDLRLPIDALRHALLARPDVVHEIHHRKMEELVASVLSDFVGSCEVQLCGKTGDGGIDLILVVSDTPFAVQVKRRTKPSGVEGVEEVRLFLAAMQLGGVTRGVFVTTADHFTGAAREVASKAITMNLVTGFELIDRHRFFGLLQETTSATDTPMWQRHFEYDPWAT